MADNTLNPARWAHGISKLHAAQKITEADKFIGHSKTVLAIKNATLNGQFDVVVPMMYPELANELEKLGYKLEYKTADHTKDVKISWLELKDNNTNQ